jgi:hypothetical protein
MSEKLKIDLENLDELLQMGFIQEHEWHRRRIERLAADGKSFNHLSITIHVYQCG